MYPTGLGVVDFIPLDNNIVASTGVTIELDSTSYTTVEGMPARVCALVTGDVTLAASAQVLFTLQFTPLTAGSKTGEKGWMGVRVWPQQREIKWVITAAFYELVLC